MKKERFLAWFSCGITSAVACKLALNKYGKENVDLYYIGIKSAHNDNDRFIAECEKWYGKKINIVSSKDAVDQFDVIEQSKYINGPAGARCTLILKKEVRRKVENDLQLPRQVFGFEFSKKEINRAVRFAQQYPHTKPYYPLIENKLTKNQCADILLMNSIELPEMYKLGYSNNNCIGCVKGGMSYWNMIRQHFPETFNRMAKLERQVNRTCIRKDIKGGGSVPVWLDELDPNAGRKNKPVTPNCGTFCEIEFADLIDPITDEILSGRKTFEQLQLFN